jgi:hypothetical protein
MTQDRIARYRRLASAERHAGRAQLLKPLADESDRGVLVTADWLPPAKLSVLPRISPNEALVTPTRHGFRFSSCSEGNPRMPSPLPILLLASQLTAGVPADARHGT